VKSSIGECPCEITAQWKQLLAELWNGLVGSQMETRLAAVLLGEGMGDRVADKSAWRMVQHRRRWSRKRSRIAGHPVTVRLCREPG